MLFQPQRVFIERAVLDLPLTRRVLARLEAAVPVEVVATAGRIPAAPRGTAREVYGASKRMLIISRAPGQPLRGCRPSADYELPLGASCPGLCQYCYLQSSLGTRPYVRVYADLDEIMRAVTRKAEAEPEAALSFEAASTSDPIAVEHLTGALAELIPFFGQTPRSSLRLVTKFAYTEGLLGLDHARRTKVRYSLNTPFVVGNYEAGTDAVADRIEAANRIGHAGYPVGFVLAPLMIYQGWEADYRDLLRLLAERLAPDLHAGLTFELISHRFTSKAKEIIQARFPRCRLDLDESHRRVKWGRYGHTKFVYPTEELRRLWLLVQESIVRHFPQAVIEYST
ncbi:MAG: spore photoproduct lyase family protein [Bacteroidota bacterium]